jgi:hypothetical protein
VEEPVDRVDRTCRRKAAADFDQPLRRIAANQCLQHQRIARTVEHVLEIEVESGRLRLRQRTRRHEREQALPRRGHRVTVDRDAGELRSGLGQRADVLLQFGRIGDGRLVGSGHGEQLRMRFPFFGSVHRMKKLDR